VVTVAHDNDRSLLHDGRYYSPLINTMEDDLARRGTECVSVARIISRIKGPLSHGRVFSPEGRFARALVTKRLKGRFGKVDYPYSRMEESVWGDILDQTGAKKVFGIQPSRELCVAGRKRGVWVADVQHGVISESHPWYGERFRGRDPVEHLPHAFLCWDYGSERVISKWAQPKGIGTIVTGNRWVARFLHRDRHDTLVNKLFDRFEAETSKAPDRPTILVSLSWGDINIPNGFMVDALRNVIRSTGDRYQWRVRLHPNQIKGFATHEGRRFTAWQRENLDGHVEWELTTRSALPVILKSTDLHISWNSSVSIEAAQMGIRSALLDPRLRSPALKGDYYEYYRDNGMIELVEETEPSVHAWIERNIASKKSPENFDQFDQAYRDLLQFLSN
jgi:hypothetical protein